MIKKLLRTFLVPVLAGAYLWISTKFPDLPMSQATFTETVMFLIASVIAQFSGNQAVDKVKKKMQD